MKTQADIHSAIGASLDGLGGILRCSVCGRWEWMTGAGQYVASGWPMCHGYTMTWVTRRLLDEDGWSPE